MYVATKICFLEITGFLTVLIKFSNQQKVFKTNKYYTCWNMTGAVSANIEKLWIVSLISKASKI